MQANTGKCQEQKHHLKKDNQVIQRAEQKGLKGIVFDTDIQIVMKENYTFDFKGQDVPKLDTLAFEFFKLFARFEFALKAMKYFKKQKRAEPDWDTFAAKKGYVVLETKDESVQEAISFLFKEPYRYAPLSRSRRMRAPASLQRII